jgi:hypothetical protein
MCDPIWLYDDDGHGRIEHEEHCAKSAGRETLTSIHVPPPPRPLAAYHRQGGVYPARHGLYRVCPWVYLSTMGRGPLSAIVASMEVVS